MTEYADKMKALRKSTTQALDEPQPSYRVTAALPKGGDIDEQFALIETEYDYGSPASDPTHRKIQVGDSLPEGEVTGITSEGIKVIPDVGDEYVIPLGGRPGYKQPGEKTKKTKPITKAEMDKLIADHKKAMDRFSDLRQQAMELMNPFSGFNPDGTIAETDYKAGAENILANTEIYGDHIPGAEDMSPDELREASFDAAAKNYAQSYEYKQPYTEEDVEIDGIPYSRETYDSGEVFLVPTGEEGEVMRDHDDKEQKEKFEDLKAKVEAHEWL